MVKPEALNIVTQQYNNKLAQINQTPDATIEEKNTAIQQLNQNKQQALKPSIKHKLIKKLIKSKTKRFKI